jgi:hypothetical protein
VKPTSLRLASGLRLAAHPARRHIAKNLKPVERSRQQKKMNNAENHI